MVKSDQTRTQMSNKKEDKRASLPTGHIKPKSLDMDALAAGDDNDILAGDGSALKPAPRSALPGHRRGQSNVSDAASTGSGQEKTPVSPLAAGGGVSHTRNQSFGENLGAGTSQTNSDEGDEEAGGNGKLVYVARDPRDVITSNYFFMGEPKDGWDGSMQRFLAPAARTPNAFGGWPEHVTGFEQLVAKLGPERAVLVEYEEMHADLPGQLRRLAALLGPAAEARLAAHGDEICAALGFSAMQGEGSSDARFLRKGKAGGWREHFSDGDAARVAAMVDERLPAATSAVGRNSWRARS